MTQIPIYRAKKIEQKEIEKLFMYVSGKLIYKVAKGNKKAGSIAGTIDKSGYLTILISGKRFLAHRIVYALFYGDLEDELKIDHINKDKLDNRIENLRKVTVQENGFNSKCKGYSYNKLEGKYKAKIVKDSKAIHLGSFDNEDDARKAYLEGKEKYHIIKDRQC